MTFAKTFKALRPELDFCRRQRTRPIFNAVSGEKMALAGCSALPVQDMLDYAKDKGGSALRAHDISSAGKNAESRGALSERAQTTAVRYFFHHWCNA